MYTLFEHSDKLNNPYECFLFDTQKEFFPIRPHWHYFAEILYITQGEAMITCNEETFIVGKSELILFPPSMIHAIYATNDAPLQYYVLKFDLNQLQSSISSTELGTINFAAIFQNSIHQKHAPVHFTFPESAYSINCINSESVLRIIEECVKEKSEQQYGYLSIIRSKICNLLIELLRIWRVNGFQTDCTLPSLSQDNTIYTITEYIDQHIGEELHAERLAELCNMSYSYFAKNFHEIYGQSCKKYIASLRLFKVENMLLFTNYDLNYISQETGFSDCSHLIRTFKEKHGITPHQFRLSKNNQ